MNITIQPSCFEALDPGIAIRYNSVSKSPIEGRFTLLIFSTASNVTVKITSKLSELSSLGELKAQDIPIVKQNPVPLLVALLLTRRQTPK